MTDKKLSIDVTRTDIDSSLSHVIETSNNMFLKILIPLKQVTKISVAFRFY